VDAGDGKIKGKWQATNLPGAEQKRCPHSKAAPFGAAMHSGEKASSA